MLSVYTNNQRGALATAHAAKTYEPKFNGHSIKLTQNTIYGGQHHAPSATSYQS
jgi:hypothetical protein